MPKNTKLILDKSNMKNNADKDHCINRTYVLFMPISIGQDYHESNKLIESIFLINKNFINTTLLKVIIVDLAQRYHLAIKSKTLPESMQQKAKKDGLDWKERYSNFITKQLKHIKVEFSTWNQWLNHEYYPQARKKIDILYNDKKSDFKSFLEADLVEFQRRHFNREAIHFSDNEKEYCRECIKEECAVLIIWGKDQISPDYSCIFYPKKMPAALSFIKHNFTHFISMFAVFSSKSKIKLSTRQGEHEVRSQGAPDRPALTGQAGNASRCKLIVGATARSPECVSACPTQDESGSTFSCVMRTNFGGTTAKIFPEDSDSLVDNRRNSLNNNNDVSLVLTRRKLSF
jgi:hypothetical protein